MCRVTALSPGGQHRLIDIAYNGIAATCRQKAQADIAGPAGKIDKRLAGLRGDPVDHCRFPQAMHAATHQVIHQIIARRHRIKHITHHAALGCPAHGPVTEINLRVVRVAVIMCLVSHL